jgi:hypothetical protein
VSGQPTFSFSDPAAGLHCFGRSGASAVILGQDARATPMPVEFKAGGDLADRFDVAIPGICEAQLEPLGDPFVFSEHQRRASLCRLRGSAVGGRELSGFGCVTVAAADRGGQALRRGLWICFGAELGFGLVSERDSRAGGHGDEQVAAFVARGAPLEATALEDPRLSSTYREDGQLLRAGLELWEGDDESDGGSARDRARALRIAGETIAAGELDADGHAPAAVAFLVWHYDGHEGIGAYVIERTLT